MAEFELKRGTVNFVLMRHDADCPALMSQSALDCTCQAELEAVKQSRFVAAMEQTRRERRKAARAAEKVMRKAARSSKG